MNISGAPPPGLMNCLAVSNHELIRTRRRSCFTSAGSMIRSQQFTIQHQAPLLIYVGRLGVEKRLRDLREVLSKLPGARLAFVGKGPDMDGLREYFAGESVPPTATGTEPTLDSTLGRVWYQARPPCSPGCCKARSSRAPSWCEQRLFTPTAMNRRGALARLRRRRRLCDALRFGDARFRRARVDGEL